MKTVITYKGQKVECYGKWREDSNAEVVFGDEALDGVYCEGAANWTEVVKTMVDYATKRGTTVEEMSAV